MKLMLIDLQGKKIQQLYIYNILHGIDETLLHWNTIDERKYYLFTIQQK